MDEKKDEKIFRVKFEIFIWGLKGLYLNFDL